MAQLSPHLQQATGVTAVRGEGCYLYDADGTRVAKGSITNWSAGCDPTTNGFQFNTGVAVTAMVTGGSTAANNINHLASGSTGRGARDGVG